MMKRWVCASKDAITKSDQSSTKIGSPLWVELDESDNVLSMSQQCILRVDETNEDQWREYIKYSEEEIKEARNNKQVLPEKRAEVKLVSPFAEKSLPTGEKLYLRTHGVHKTILAGQTDTIELVVPYARAKINETEVVEGVTSCINFKVNHPIAGTLDHFGKDVCIGEKVYSRKSDYDAELVSGLVLSTEIENSSSIDKVYGVNYVLHEIK